MAELQLQNERISIPKSLGAVSSSSGASTYASCSDWCAEACGNCNELGGQCTTCAQKGGQCSTCAQKGGQCSTCAQKNNQGCSDWCAEACGTCVELGGQTCNTCSQNGGQCSTCAQAGGQCSTCAQTGAQAPSSAPSITSVSANVTSISLSWSGVTYASSYTVAYRKSSSSNATYISVSSRSYTITGLEPGTEYVVNVRAVNGYGEGPYGSGRTVSTLPARPGNWSWWSLVATGEKIRISAGEWNAFCTRINEFRRYKGYSLYSFTTVRSGDLISASVMREAVAALNAIASGVPAGPVAGGSVISAAFFNGLKDALNGIA